MAKSQYIAYRYIFLFRLRGEQRTLWQSVPIGFRLVTPFPPYDFPREEALARNLLL